MNHHFTPSNKQGASVQLFLPTDCVIKEKEDISLKKSSQKKEISFPIQDPVQNTKTCKHLEAGSDLQTFEKQKAGSQSKVEKEHSSSSRNAIVKMHQIVQNLDKEVKQLKADQKNSISDTIAELRDSASDIEERVTTLEEMVKSKHSKNEFHVE